MISVELRRDALVGGVAGLFGGFIYGLAGDDG
jgi:hypothetical protein